MVIRAVEKSIKQPERSRSLWLQKIQESRVEARLRWQTGAETEVKLM